MPSEGNLWMKWANLNHHQRASQWWHLVAKSVHSSLPNLRENLRGEEAQVNHVVIGGERETIDAEAKNECLSSWWSHFCLDANHGRWNECQKWRHLEEIQSQCMDHFPSAKGSPAKDHSNVQTKLKKGPNQVYVLRYTLLLLR